MATTNKSKVKGISVIVTSETEYKKVQDFLTKDILYIAWHDNMLLHETAVVLKANKKSDFSTGSVGRAKYQRECGIKTVPFIENLSAYLIN